MVPSLNPRLQGPYPLIDLLFDLEIAKEREKSNLLCGTYVLPDSDLEEIKERLIIYNN